MTHLFAEWCLASREDLSHRLAGWLDRHLAGCARCRAVAERAAAMREALEPVRRSRPPALDFDRIERRIRQEADKTPARPAFPRALVFAAVAALATVVVVSSRSTGPNRPLGAAPTGEPEPEVAVREPAQGIVTLVQGSVFGSSALNRRERRIVARMKLREGFRLVTASKAAVVVQTSPRTGFRLEERSRAEIARLRDGQLELDLLHGSVGSSVAPLATGDAFAIRVGSMTVHVRGTRFSVARDEDRVTVEVLEGVVLVERHLESVSLRAPARAVFDVRTPLASSGHSAPQAPAESLAAASLNLADHWPETLASLHVPGDRGAGGEVRVDGAVLGTTPLLVLREPGPATVELLREGRVTRFEVDVEGHDVEPGPPVEATVPPTAPAVGRLESAAIRRVIQAHVRDVQSCYNRRLKRNPTAQGRVEMRFTIAADGHVSDAHAQRGATDADIAACLETTVRTWTFDRPEGGAVTVVYPLSFAPAGAESSE